MSAGREDLTQSPSVTVRWQAQMEQHLEDMRAFTREAVGLPSNSEVAIHNAATRAALAQAHATAAVALAIANAVGDLELPLSTIADAARNIGDQT